MKKILKVSIICLLIDTLFIPFIPSAILAFCIVFILLPKTIFSIIKKNMQVFKLNLIKILSFCFVIFISFQYVYFNNYISKKRTLELANYCYDFKSDNGRYPNNITELIPKYIKRIPLARYTITTAKFRYSNFGPSIIFMSAPDPDAVWAYNIDIKKWY